MTTTQGSISEYCSGLACKSGLRMNCIRLFDETTDLTFLYSQQCNDVELMAYLGVITQGCQAMNQVKYNYYSFSSLILHLVRALTREIYQYNILI